MFHKLAQKSQMVTVYKRFMTRIPSIKFTRGDRSAIERDMAALALVKPKWFADWSNNSSAISSSNQRSPQQSGKPYVVGGKTTNVVYMDSEFYGNPFNPTAQLMSFDESTLDMIELGGAYDPPVKKDDKKKK